MRAYPLENDWRKGCWVARVTGPHDTYVFDREFCRGRPVKASGLVLYSYADLGGFSCWVVRKDRREVRDLVAVTELGWESFGELSSRGILDVHEEGAPGLTPYSWTGERCVDCSGPSFPGGAGCPACERERDSDREILEARTAAMSSDLEPF